MLSGGTCPDHGVRHGGSSANRTEATTAAIKDLHGRQAHGASAENHGTDTATSEERLLLSQDVVTEDYLKHLGDKIDGVNRRARRPVVEFSVRPNPDYAPAKYRAEDENHEVLCAHVASVWALPGAGIGRAGKTMFGAWDFSGDGEPIAYGDALDRGDIPDPSVCDHCATRRKRSMVYVFEDENGGRMHIGSNCLRDITGASTSNMLWLAKHLAAGDDWFGDKDEVRRGGGGKRKATDVRLFVAASIIAMNRSEGRYVSASGADHELGEPTTKQAALDEYIDQPQYPGDDAAPDVLERWQKHAAAWDEAIAEADTVLAWARELDADHGFEQNLRAVAGSTTIGRRARGLAAYLPEAYRRAAARAAAKPKYDDVAEDQIRTGEVPSGRVEHTGRVLSIKAREVFAGWRPRTVLKALIRCGDYDIWGTIPSNAAADGNYIQTGDLIRFRATTESGEERGFGFYKRPSAAAVVERMTDSDGDEN